MRPGEVRGATREEFDLKKAVWCIPAERMKMRAPHQVQLSKQALAVLEDIWPYSKHGTFVFPPIRSNRRPLSEKALDSALRRTYNRATYFKQRVKLVQEWANLLGDLRGEDKV